MSLGTARMIGRFRGHVARVTSRTAELRNGAKSAPTSAADSPKPTSATPPPLPKSATPPPLPTSAAPPPLPTSATPPPLPTSGTIQASPATALEESAPKSGFLSPFGGVSNTSNGPLQLEVTRPAQPEHSNEIDGFVKRLLERATTGSESGLEQAARTDVPHGGRNSVQTKKSRRLPKLIKTRFQAIDRSEAEAKVNTRQRDFTINGDIGERNTTTVDQLHRVGKIKEEFRGEISHTIHLRSQVAVARLSEVGDESPSEVRFICRQGNQTSRTVTGGIHSPPEFFYGVSDSSRPSHMYVLNQKNQLSVHDDRGESLFNLAGKPIGQLERGRAGELRATVATEQGPLVQVFAADGKPLRDEKPNREVVWRNPKSDRLEIYSPS